MNSKVAVTSDLNPSTTARPVTFTATVTPDPPGGSLPTGRVDFYDGENRIGIVGLVNGVATFFTNTLGAGDHQIKALYSGDGTYPPSVSGAYVQSVKKSPTFIIGEFPPSIVYGQTLVTDAVVFVTSPTPTLPTGQA